MDDSYDTLDQSSVPRMDLSNFEEPSFEDSKYVLTSPRSLEACSRLGVKPVDLLYKPLAEFQEELLPQDVPLRTIYNIYDEHERNRETKLALCREERQRIMVEERDRPKSGKGVAVTRPGYGGRQKSTLRESKLLSRSDENLDQGSLQRQRTAWATSVGHERVTNDDINHRVRDLHNESMKLRQELLSRKEKKAALSRKSKKRTRSAGSVTLAGSSMINRTNVADARPISNTRLRKALKSSVDTRNTPVTPRDQKILNLMMSKGELEKAQAEERHLRDLEWDLQRKREEELKITSEMRRREILAEENRIRDLKKREKELRQKRLENHVVEDREKILCQNRKKWALQSSQQDKLKDLKLAEKLEREQLRKSAQEKNLRSLNQDEEEMTEMVLLKQKRDLETAAQRKETYLLQESMKKVLQNRNQRRSFEDRHRAMEEQTVKELENQLALMELRHKQAKANYDQVYHRKEQEILISRLDREKKALQAKLSQRKLEEDMEDWKASVKVHRQSVEQQAEETAKRTVDIKKQRAHEDRVNKEKEQQRNIRKIQEEVEAWKRETEGQIKKKDRQSSKIQKEKEETINKSRQIAFASQKLRNEIRDRYGGQSFDKMAFQAELYSKLGTGYMAMAKNSSQFGVP